MKNLVLAVSPDSSLDLLKPHADIIVLDKDVPEFVDEYYDTVYIRSHFSQPSTMPQNFQSEIEEVVERVKHTNNNVRFIDGMYTVDAIVAFEDKWLQYETFNEFMPRTQLLDTHTDISSFDRPIYKNRLSSRGSGVTWDRRTTEDSVHGWIVQESIEIKEELRVYIILGEVYSVGAVKRSMTEGDKAESVDSRALSQDEIDFTRRAMKQSPTLDIAGIDIARTINGKLILLEVNRSPGFAKFYEITGVNLADRLYERKDDY
ncbi:MAG: hypothetical protein EOO17_02330 [Chloroflexi bacterium]|nr:MAG: hypothetical protein EOO17_02330 [Chloroflexota bacterium]